MGGSPVAVHTSSCEDLIAVNNLRHGSQFFTRTLALTAKTIPIHPHEKIDYSTIDKYDVKGKEHMEVVCNIIMTLPFDLDSTLCFSINCIIE